MVDQEAFIAGNGDVHEHYRAGRLSIRRGLARASRDIPPFAMVTDPHTVRGLNRVGLERAGFDRERMRALNAAFRILFRVRTNLRLAMARVEAEISSPDVDYLLAFIRASRRGVAFGPGRDQRGRSA